MSALLAASLMLLALSGAVAGAAPPSEAGKSRSPFAGDTRLEKRITLEFAKTPLNEALADVTRQTGVKLVALERAADEPVALYVRDQPAAEVLRQVAELLGYWWSRRGTAAEPRYEIYQDLRSKNEEAAILSGARRAVVETLQKELGRHRRFANLPQAELDKRAAAGDADLAKMMGGGGGGFGAPGQQSEAMHEWQAARNVATPLGRIMLGVVERLTPAQWQTLLNGDPITYSTEPKAGELRLAAETATSLRGVKPTSSVPFGVGDSLGPEIKEAMRVMQEKSQEEWSRATGYRIDVQLTLSMGSQPVGLLRVAPQPVGGTPGMSALTGFNLFAMPELNPTAPKETPEARKARLAADPFLAKKGQLPPAEPGGTSFMPFLQRTGSTLKRIAAGYHVNLVADAYTSGSVGFGGAPPSPPPAGQAAAPDAGDPLYEMLDRFFGMQRDWTRDGEFIRLRSRTWAFDRNVEIPSRLIRRWAEAWKERNGWDLDQLASIVDQLRQEQIMTFELAAQEYEIPSGGQLFMLLLSADALRLYAHLAPPQRQALVDGKPLALGSLTLAQRPYALDMARGRGRSIVQMFMGPPPWRSPQDLARAELTLKGMPAQALPFGGAGPPAAPRPAGAPAAQTPPAAPAAPPRVMAIFELKYPQGQPEGYVVPGVLPPGTPLPKAEGK
jgi:hypothetical protein